eukprot:1807360-Rhodomonas_salina.1
MHVHEVVGALVSISAKHCLTHVALTAFSTTGAPRSHTRSRSFHLLVGRRQFKTTPVFDCPGPDLRDAVTEQKVVGRTRGPAGEHGGAGEAAPNVRRPQHSRRQPDERQQPGSRHGTSRTLLMDPTLVMAPNCGGVDGGDDDDCDDGDDVDCRGREDDDDDDLRAYALVSR